MPGCEATASLGTAKTNPYGCDLITEQHKGAVEKTAPSFIKLYPVIRQSVFFLCFYLYSHPFPPFLPA